MNLFRLALARSVPSPMKLLRHALACLGLTLVCQGAESLTRSQSVDFFRDVGGRSLRGLAARSDGRLIPGPVLRNLSGTAPAPILWALEPSGADWLVGSSPDGAVFQLNADLEAATFTSRELFRLGDTHALSVRALAGGRVLAGSSPHGRLVLWGGSRVEARLRLPVDSILDILPDGDSAVLVATGGPARVYRVDLKAFAAFGEKADAVADEAQLKAAGITLFGESRDRNLRCLVRLSDGRVAAGSDPRGNVYVFPAAGGPPTVLLENKEGEVTDLLPGPDGGVYVALVSGSAPTEQRITRAQAQQAKADAQQQGSPNPAPVQPAPASSLTASGFPAFELPPSAPVEKFPGRSSLHWLPRDGFPEVLASRNNHSVYRLAQYEHLILMAGGEQGECIAYDTVRRASVNLPASVSAQLVALRPVPGKAGRYLLLRNNLAGLSILDFSGQETRTAETRRIDLGVLGRLGALRIARTPGIDPTLLRLEASVSSGSEEGEGWSAWTPLKLEDGGLQGNLGWRSETSLRGRFVRLRLSLPAALPAEASIDKAQWYFAAQNRRPVLTDFRSLSPGFGILPAAEPQSSPVASLNQVLSQGASAEPSNERRRSQFLSSQVIPAPAYQAFVWNVTDPDGDRLVASFSLRRLGDTEWNEVVAETRESFAQIDLSHLAEGVYQTRLIVREDAPRPLAERLSVDFETDDLVVDRTAPEFVSAEARIEGEHLYVKVEAADTLSLLEGLAISLNNGVEATTEHPDDGIRDARRENFTLKLPLRQSAGATSLDASVFDAAGNRSTRTLRWK